MTTAKDFPIIRQLVTRAVDAEPSEYSREDHVVNISTCEDGVAMCEPLTVVVDNYIVFPPERYGEEFS